MTFFKPPSSHSIVCTVYTDKRAPYILLYSRPEFPKQNFSSKPEEVQELVWRLLLYWKFNSRTMYIIFYIPKVGSY